MTRALLTVASYSPHYGGPALSVSRLGASLAGLGVDVALWAPDGSAMSAEAAIAAEALVRRGASSNGGCLIRLGGSLDAALAAFRLPDVVHDNGVWLPFHHEVARAAARLGIARIVSPRGMLEPWAFNYKRAKKRLAWLLYQRRDLASAAALHATSQNEADNLVRLGLAAPVAIAPNGMDLPKSVGRSRSDGPRTALFLSRVHPKKGLPILIEAVARLRPAGWRFVIAGPDELGHTAEMKALSVAQGVSEAFSFVGPQYGSEKTALYSEADLFVLPTYSENFGMAVAEALAHEIPVITTTGAPWPELVSQNCGWWVEPTVEAFGVALNEAIGMGADERARMGRRGRALVAATLCWDTVARRIAVLYDEVSIPWARISGPANLPTETPGVLSETR